MRVAPVSGDFMVKLAIGAALLGLAWWALERARSAASDAVGGALSSIGEAVNPASADNLINRAVTAIGEAITGPQSPGRNADGSWTVGAWLYDVTHDDPTNPPDTVEPAFYELPGSQGYAAP
jgi:hypothetical protein